MRTFCSLNLDVVYSPEHKNLKNIVLYKRLLEYIFEVEVGPQLDDHYCDISAPCAVLRRDMQAYVNCLLVCKSWNELATSILSQSHFVILKVLSRRAFFSSSAVAESISLGGRYRGHTAIAIESKKSVFKGVDYGSADGCQGAIGVIVKISNNLGQYRTEKEVYTWLADAKTRPSYVPQLILGDKYPHTSYYGLVLSKLGPDLERIRSVHTPHCRFTPKMTLSVAIQTIGIYEQFHEQGWLHLSAKPDNFAVGPQKPGEDTRIFMFDFEQSTRIEPALTDNYTAFVAWNPLFKPINLYMNITPSRRDDMQGLAYVFSYLERGSLPWQRINLEGFWNAKECTPSSKLFEGMHPAYCAFFNDVKALAWGESPDYKQLIRRFVQVWEEREYGGTPGEMKWWDDFGLKM